MKIKSVKAFLIKSDLTGGQIKTEPRRPAWTSHAEVAGPMSRFARFKKLRTTWRPNLPSVGVWAAFGVGLRGFLAVPARLRVFNVAMAVLLALSVVPFVL